MIVHYYSRCNNILIQCCLADSVVFFLAAVFVLCFFKTVFLFDCRQLIKAKWIWPFMHATMLYHKCLLDFTCILRFLNVIWKDNGYTLNMTCAHTPACTLHTGDRCCGWMFLMKNSSHSSLLLPLLFSFLSSFLSLALSFLLHHDSGTAIFQMDSIFCLIWQMFCLGRAGV